MSQNLLRFHSRCESCLRQQLCFYSTKVNDGRALHLSKIMNIPKTSADYMCLKYPMLVKLKKPQLQDVIDTATHLGLNTQALLEEPIIFSIPPITLKLRYRVLQECGLYSISAYHIANCLNIIRRRTIGHLREDGTLIPSINIENHLARYMTQWPNSLTTLIQCEINEQTLYSLRLKIIQRYLELLLGMNQEEFCRCLHTYPTIKLRPLKMISETLSILQNIINMPLYKIKNNLYLVHANSDNLKQIIYEQKSIAGIDIKEVLRMHPKLCLVNSSNIEKIKDIFKVYEISDEAQQKCLNIFSLGPNTIRDRLEKSRETPEFKVYLNHPRFLKIILYNKNATKRVLDFYKTSKKCLSLNSLSGCTEDFKKYIKSPGDRSGKGKDILFCIAHELGKKYTIMDVRKNIKRHPFWINIPLVHIKSTCEKLSIDFSKEDIFQNCPILLYSFRDVKQALKIIENNHFKALSFIEHIDMSKLNKSQILSLVLYILEKNHYFSGNGVWNDENQIPTFNSGSDKRSEVI